MSRPDFPSVGVFLQARPLACAGTLGIDKPLYPQLPGARRGGT